MKNLGNIKWSLDEIERILQRGWSTFDTPSFFMVFQLLDEVCNRNMEPLLKEKYNPHIWNQCDYNTKKTIHLSIDK